ncbi:MAG: ABC transporter ATP-binding protein, partial [Isosphaeraceae bacterium]
QSRKLSFKERKELESLPGRIELLENAVQELHAAMADPSFYRKDRDEIAGARNRLEDLEREMASAYARWHALEELAG